MIDDQRPGTIYWIDHYVVGTNDVESFVDFHTKVLGARTHPVSEERRREFGVFQDVGAGVCHHGGFVQKAPLPPSAGLGKGKPRHGFFIRQEDVEEHLRRLDQYSVPHTDPVHTSEDGEEGIAIYFEDPDRNQFEFWGPNRLPDGAMEDVGPLKLGRISHGVYESRDLQRTADLFNRYCALDPASSADIPADTLVLPLAAGGRVVFKQVDTLSERTGGRGVFRGLHAALVVRDEDFFPNYERMWAELPEWEFDERKDSAPAEAVDLPARTVLHGSPAGREWKKLYGRGDDWYDWDTNCFHFFGGEARHGTMADYEPHSMEVHLERYREAHGIKSEGREARA